ncbi:MAG: putative acyltransferase, partial [Gammaproteobacteria bacterium]
MSTNKTTRLQSLDAFRGFTILAMILVNTPGSWSHLYSPLSHADWHGCTPTDLVFPFFLFIVGVSVWFSSSKFNYELNAAVFKKITKRAFLIFLIGLLLNAFP